MCRLCCQWFEMLFCENIRYDIFRNESYEHFHIDQLSFNGSFFSQIFADEKPQSFADKKRAKRPGILSCQISAVSFQLSAFSLYSGTKG